MNLTVYLLFPMPPLTTTTHSIKASSNPITSTDERRCMHPNADAASTSISYDVCPCHEFTDCLFTFLACSFEDML